MAYLRPFNTTCQSAGCKRHATVEVLSNRNSSYGKFCRACGQREVARIEKQEQTERERQGNG